MRNKTDIVHDYILEKKIDLCCCVETWLKESDELLMKHLTPNGFDILHHYRKGRTGGGVAVLCKSEYKAKIDKLPDYTSFEYISIILQSLDLPVCVVYRPPSIDGISGGTFFHENAKLFEILSIDKKRLLLLGDFNFPLNKCKEPNSIKFTKLLEEFSLQQHVTLPTCKSLNTLDLVITRSSNEILLTKPKVKDFISDHAAIICHLCCPKPSAESKQFSYRRIKDIDVPAFKNDI